MVFKNETKTNVVCVGFAHQPNKVRINAGIEFFQTFQKCVHLHVNHRIFCDERQIGIFSSRHQQAQCVDKIVHKRAKIKFVPTSGQHALWVWKAKQHRWQIRAGEWAQQIPQLFRTIGFYFVAFNFKRLQQCDATWAKRDSETIGRQKLPPFRGVP